MRYSIRTVTPLAEIETAISLDEAKAHLRVDQDDEDALIEAYLRSAQDHIERFTSQVLTPRVMEYACGAFPCGAASEIRLPRDPVTGIVAIHYLDSTGAEIDLIEDDWRWSESAAELLRPAFGTSWPTPASETGSVRVTFEAGYEVGLCPGSLIGAVKLMLGALYGQRENVITGISVAELPFGVTALCAPYRRVSI